MPDAGSIKVGTECLLTAKQKSEQARSTLRLKKSWVEEAVHGHEPHSLATVTTIDWS